MVDKKVKSYKKKPYVVWRLVDFSFDELQNILPSLKSAADGIPIVTNGKVRLRRGNHTDIVTISKK